MSSVLEGALVSEESRVSPDINVVSPELVLVDPVCAAEARLHLPRPDDTLARVELLVQAHRIIVARAPLAGAAPLPDMLHPAGQPADTVRVPSRLPRRTSGHRRAALLTGGAAAAALASALLVGVRVDLHGSPAGADPTSIDEAPVTSTLLETTATVPIPPVPTPHVTHRPNRPGRRNSTPSGTGDARRFVWAPVPGASGYHVEFFRASKLVFSGDTTKPELRLPGTWTFGGVRMSLRPGEYRWNVWPVVAGRRGSHAVVQAELVIPTD